MAKFNLRLLNVNIDFFLRAIGPRDIDWGLVIVRNLGVNRAKGVSPIMRCIGSQARDELIEVYTVSIVGLTAIYREVLWAVTP